MERQTCSAHDLLLQNVSTLRSDIGQLYDIARKTSDEAGELTTRMSMLEIKQELGFGNIEKRLDEYEAQQANFNSKLIYSIDHTKTKWNPAQIIALISAILGPAGIAAWAVFFR